MTVYIYARSISSKWKGIEVVKHPQFNQPQRNQQQFTPNPLCSTTFPRDGETGVKVSLCWNQAKQAFSHHMPVNRGPATTFTRDY